MSMIYCFVFGAEVATFLFAPNGQFTRATKKHSDFAVRCSFRFELWRETTLDTSEMYGFYKVQVLNL